MPSPPSQTASWRHAPDGVEIRIADRAVLLLMPAEGRVRVGLVMPVVDRVIDVSVQPATSWRAVEESARRGRTPASSAEAVARAALRESAVLAGCPAPAEHLCLRRAFGAIAFPLLASAFDAGADPVDEVPRWAAPVLVSRTIGDAARAAFAHNATRPVRRALVRTLQPTPAGELDLAVLALALIGSSSLEPDRLARVLQAEGSGHPQADLPDPAALRVARRVVQDWSHEWGEARVESVLVDAVGRPDGLRVLMDTVAYARQLGDHVPQLVPRTLGELHDAHRTLMRTAVVATAPTVRPRDADPVLHEPPEPLEPLRQFARPAPWVSLPAPSPLTGDRRTGAPLPRSRFLALDGASRGDLTLLLPRGADLARWGRVLSNCLADFDSAVQRGHSVVIGVLRRHRLTYAVELTPSGVIRQFNGARNRPPALADLRTVVEMLAAAGVLDPAEPANRPWLDAADLTSDSQAG